MLTLKLLICIIIFGLSCRWIDQYGSNKSIVINKPSDETSAQPVLLVNDEDINERTFTEIQQGIHDDDDDIDDVEVKPDKSVIQRKKLIVSGNLKIKRFIIFSNSTKFSLKKVSIKKIKKK